MEAYWGSGDYFGRNLTSTVAAFFDTFTKVDFKEMLELAMERSKTAKEAYIFLVGWMGSIFFRDDEIKTLLTQLAIL